jgi:S-adenosylmethionine-diacylglycerol 3-amino-3-carboxypropyl transferase
MWSVSNMTTSTVTELRSEIAQIMSLDIIRYSQVWEDHQVLCDGLNIGSDDDVLSIASSGCNVFAMLLAGAKSITAIDMSAAQIALVELKIVAIRTFSHEVFVAFIGASKMIEDRIVLYRQLRHQLSVQSQLFWDVHTEEIAQGVIHCGRFDRYLRVFLDTVISKIWPKGSQQALLDANSLIEQQAIYNDLCDSPEFRNSFRRYAGKEMMSLLGRDLAQLKYVEIPDLGSHFLDRFRHCLINISNDENFYMEYSLLGHYRDLEKGPLYMRAENFEQLKGLVDRVHLVTDEIESYLNKVPPGTYSKVNLSDIFEYMSDADSQQLFKLLAKRLRSKGRLAYWNLLVPRTPSAPLLGKLKPLTALSERHHKIDRTWFYKSFHIDELQVV